MFARTLALASLVVVAASAAGAGPKLRRLPVAEYVDRMKAGWVGQMAGVGWGGPTEFKVRGRIMDASQVPRWHPGRVNQFGQDDIYVEMTFLRTLEVHGLDCSIRQAGIDFANSGYRLWHANRAGRDNLRKGIAPPDSGHPRFNKHADDIDYQIEADYSGLIAPGMGNLAVRLGERFGRLMNYGDGLYAGQFVGAMYAEAFFESDPAAIARKALAYIPAESQYAGMVRDVLEWHGTNPGDWQATWKLVEARYHRDPEYTHGLCSKPGGEGAYSIDAKLNGAYILIGLLYGDGDMDKTIVISTRCGQDSDCNPSNAAGVLATTIGFEKLPDRYTSAIDPKGRFSHTPYTFPKLIDVCRKLARQAVLDAGGEIDAPGSDREALLIPAAKPEPTALERSWEPGPIADSRFTPAERAQIKPPPDEPQRRAGRAVSKADISDAVAKFAPGWEVSDCGSDMEPGLRGEWGGRKGVLVTHPMGTDTPCVLGRKLAVPAEGKAVLELEVAHDPRGDWTLEIKIDGTRVMRKKIAKATVPGGWATLGIDLSAWAGRTVTVELLNHADGWQYEAAYWDRIDVVTD